MDQSEEAVREANRRFYEAFQSLDLEQMDALWLREDWVECVHPGWVMMRGWEAVRESWARIFLHTERIKVELSSLWVHVEGEVAWVACTEHVTSMYERGFDQAMVQATNLFVLRDGTWYMVAHHASPLPGSPTPSVQ